MSAVFYILFSVFTWSLMPLFAIIGLNKIDRWDFIFYVQLIGLACTWWLMRLKARKSNTRYVSFFKIDKKTHYQFAISGIAYILSILCLWSSYTYISKAGATIIFEMWPIFSMLLSPLLIKKGWEKTSFQDFFYIFLAFLGMGIILIPEMNQPFFKEKTSLMNGIFILILPFLGGLFMSISSVFKTRLSYVMSIKDEPLLSYLVMHTYSMIYSIIGAGIALLVVRWFLHMESDSTINFTTISLMLFVGIVVYALGSLSYTIGFLKSTKVDILTLWYLGPILSIVWIYLAGYAEINNYIIIGALFIICANLLITLRADDTVSYTAAILSMLFMGIFCFYIKGMGMGNYFDAVSVPLVFYAIIVSFMTDRLIRRDTAEEVLVLEIINHIQTKIDAAKVQSMNLIGHVIGIIETNNSTKIAEHYYLLRNKTQEMLDVSDKLDSLILSRVEGVNFSEVFVLTLVGVLTIMITILYRADTFASDCYAIVLVTAIIFVFFMILDMVKNRKIFNLIYHPDGTFSLNDKMLKDFFSERIMSSIMLLLVLAGLVFLMWVKHQGNLNNG